MKIKRLSSRALHSHFIFIRFESGGTAVTVFVSVFQFPFSHSQSCFSMWLNEMCAFFFRTSLHVSNFVYFCNMLSPQHMNLTARRKKKNTLNAYKQTKCWSRLFVFCHIVTILSFTLSITTMRTISAECVFCQMLMILIDIFYSRTTESHESGGSAYKIEGKKNLLK